MQLLGQEGRQPVACVGLAVAVVFSGSILASKLRRRRGKSQVCSVNHFQIWEDLSEEEKTSLLQSVKDLDIRDTQRILKASKGAARVDPQAYSPVPDKAVFQLDRSVKGWQHPKYEESAERKPLFDVGLSLIAEGKVAVLCLAGGQGTRLGSSDPKGMYKIGLVSGKSLFQLQAERIWRVQAMTAHVSGTPRGDIAQRISIPWIILTSPATDVKTRQYLRQQNYFGLLESQIFFVVQDELPCLTEEGKIILETREGAAMAPNGNGGLFLAMTKSGVLTELENQGVQYIDTYCVDNALARVADPHFIGLASLRASDVCAKVVSKAYPDEKVGVFALRNGKNIVVEYSELDPTEACATDLGTGKLKYNWANISSFCFTTDFIRKAQAHIEQTGQYHLARKQIPSVLGPVQGIKLEAFIFDPLPIADNLVLMEVDRSAHFAPVKNANGAKADTPAIAKGAVLALHKRWIEAFGGKIEVPHGEDSPEISPTKSYLGESLDFAVAGRTFKKAYDSILQGDVTDREEIKRIVADENKGQSPPPATALRRLRSVFVREKKI